MQFADVKRGKKETVDSCTCSLKVIDYALITTDSLTNDQAEQSF